MQIKDIYLYYIEFYEDLSRIKLDDLKQFLRDCRRDVYHIDLSIYKPELISFLKKYKFIRKNGYIAYSQYLSFGVSVEALIKKYPEYTNIYKNILEPLDQKDFYVSMLCVNYAVNRFLRDNNSKYSPKKFQESIRLFKFDKKTIKALQWLGFLNDDLTNKGCQGLEAMGRIVYCHPSHVARNRIPEYKQKIEICKTKLKEAEIRDLYFSE